MSIINKILFGRIHKNASKLVLHLLYFHVFLSYSPQCQYTNDKYSQHTAKQIPNSNIQKYLQNRYFCNERHHCNSCVVFYSQNAWHTCPISICISIFAQHILYIRWAYSRYFNEHKFSSKRDFFFIVTIEFWANAYDCNEVFGNNYRMLPMFWLLCKYEGFVILIS